MLAILLLLAALVANPGTLLADDDPEVATYVGSEQCRECHQDEYESYQVNSKKAHSYQSITAMEKGLATDEVLTCYECHTTGYGRPGGFKSLAETPHLANAGCETCHGPGSLHADSGDPEDIKGKLTADDCHTCHNQERVKAFGFTPVIYGGGH
jgi:hypothetical protein